MLAVFMPIIRPQGEKDADSNEDNLEQQVEERALSAAEAHWRKLKYLNVNPPIIKYGVTRKPRG
jgi:hypothetical protein